MTEVADALTTLHESIGLWMVSQRDPFRLVLCACDAIAVGVDSPSLRELGAKTRTDSTFDLPEIVARVGMELGLPPLEPDSSATLIAAARAKSRQFLNGEIEARDLTSWAHRLIGHLGPSEVEPLVILDDEFDMSRSDAEIVREVRAAAISLIET